MDLHLESESSSLISSQIAEFYQFSNGCLPNKSNKFLNTDKTYNFVEIYQYLQEEEPDLWKSLAEFQFENYLKCYRKLLPIYTQLSELDEETEWNLEWLGCNAEYVRAALNENNTITGVTIIENLLLLSAALENALGNVFYTYSKGRAPPHLLRDLLSTQELEAVFGIEALVFLKILLGSPQSINLRNIVWHGFPKPKEIPPYYVSVLLLTIHSLGCKLKEQYFTLQIRPQIKSFNILLTMLEEQFKRPTNFLQNESPEALSTCSWLQADYKLFWQQLFKHFESGQYAKFVILILPQIELLLRIIYGQTNNYDVSAKLDEYYITMDTIFECYVPTAVEVAANKVLLFESSLSEGALKCMYDLFVAPNGLRLRDKVSHGEVTIAAMNNAALCRILLYLAMNVLTTDELRFPLNNYESKFHLNCMTKEASNVAKLQWQHFVNALDCEGICCADITLHCGNVKIFRRPKREPEIMLLVVKITQLFTQICRNYEESIEERKLLLAQRELHSKRRRTLEKMLATMPDICVVLHDILNCCAVTFIKMQELASDMLFEDKEIAKLVRFLKHTLKVCENLVKYSHKQNNEWIKALELCQKFSTLRQQTFLWNS